MLRSVAVCFMILVVFIKADAQVANAPSLIFRSAPAEPTACQFNLYGLDVETGAITELTQYSTGSVRSAQWSPDGTKIAFLRAFSSDCGTGVSHGTLYIMNSDGSEKQALVSERPITNWSWSPDGIFIAYEVIEGTTSNAPLPGTGEIVIAETDHGMELKRWAGSGLKWSPDGQYMLFVRQQPDRAGFVDLYVMSRADAIPHRLTDWPGYVENYGWTPDSTQVTFSYFENFNNDYKGDLYTIARDGGEPINLTNTGLGLSIFAYSPDGSLIAYEGRFGDVWLMNADGSNQWRYSAGPQHGRRGTYPVWSPDGKYLSYEFQPDDLSTSVYQPYTLYLLDLATRTVSLPDAAIETDGAFAWTPDSKTIIYSGMVDREIELYSVPADGSEAPRIISNRPGFADVDPMWRPGQ